MPHVAFSLLKRDPYVAAYSGASFNDVQIDGQGAAFLVEDVNAAVAPPILSGHGVDAACQVVLGAATMAILHKHLGQYVTLSYGAPADAPIYVSPTRLQIVGTATFPAIGFASTVSDHTSMGTGVLFSFQMLPKAFNAAVNSGPVPALDGRTSPSSGYGPGRHPQQPWPACSDIESLALASAILQKDADWFRSLGTKESPGTKIVALNGALRRSGFVEVPIGTPLRQIAMEIGGALRQARS